MTHPNLLACRDAGRLAVRGDSNDAEHDALAALIDAVEAHLGRPARTRLAKLLTVLDDRGLDLDPQHCRALAHARGEAVAADALAHALRDLGWPSVADDVADGLSAATIISRLREIGEEHSDASELVEAIDGTS